MYLRAQAPIMPIKFQSKPLTQLPQVAQGPAPTPVQQPLEVGLPVTLRSQLEYLKERNREEDVQVVTRGLHLLISLKDKHRRFPTRRTASFVLYRKKLIDSFLGIYRTYYFDLPLKAPRFKDEAAGTPVRIRFTPEWEKTLADLSKFWGRTTEQLVKDAIFLQYNAIKSLENKNNQTGKSYTIGMLVYNSAKQITTTYSYTL